jgi:hypothetical protein
MGFDQEKWLFYDSRGFHGWEYTIIKHGWKIPELNGGFNWKIHDFWLIFPLDV